MGNLDEVLELIQDVLVCHMDDSKARPEFRIQSAAYIGRRSGRLLRGIDIISKRDTLGGLRLTMRSGDEYDLTLNVAEEGGKWLADDE